MVEEYLQIPGITREMAEDFVDRGISVDELANGKTIPERVRILAKYRQEFAEIIDINEANSICSAIEKNLRIATMESGETNIFDVLVVGSHRRGLSSEHDVDILISYEGDPPVVRDDRIEAYIADGRKKGSLIWRTGPKRVIVLDLAYCSVDELGSMLLHYTGSATFNIMMRKKAKELGYSLSEYGLFTSTGTLIHSATEREIFKLMGMKYVGPKDRTH